MIHALVLASALLAAPAMAQPASEAGVVIATIDRNTTLTISGCCSIHHDGHVTIAEGVTLDDASRRFWDAVSQLGLQNCKLTPPGKATP